VNAVAYAYEASADDLSHVVASCFAEVNAAGEALTPIDASRCSCAPCERLDRIGLDEREIGGRQ
jgi:hypothetical protein